MCLAVPMQLVTIQGDRAAVAFDGNRMTVSVTLTPEAAEGDWVLVHAGYAITIVDPDEARATYDLLARIVND